MAATPTRQQEKPGAVPSAAADLPLNEKLAALVLSLLVEDPAISVEMVIEVAAIMARHLPPEKRAAAVVWHLRAAAEELGVVKWN